MAVRDLATLWLGRLSRRYAGRLAAGLGSTSGHAGARGGVGDGSAGCVFHQDGQGLLLGRVRLAAGADGRQRNGGMALAAGRAAVQGETAQRSADELRPHGGRGQRCSCTLSRFRRGTGDSHCTSHSSWTPSHSLTRQTGLARRCNRFRSVARLSVSVHCLRVRESINVWSSAMEAQRLPNAHQPALRSNASDHAL